MKNNDDQGKSRAFSGEIKQFPRDHHTMASLTTRITFMRTAVANKFITSLNSIKRFSGTSAVTTVTALSSKKGVLLFNAVVGPVPVAAMRTSAPCCAASEDAEIVEIQIKIDGMVCDGCSSRVLEALQKVSGVKSVDVDLEKGLATIAISATTQLDAFNELPKLMETVKELGFDAEPHFG